MPRVPASQLTYGVEIECAIDSTVPIRIGGYHNGYSVTALPAGNVDRRHWRAERDGSLGGFAHGKTCVEFVSPVLRGAEGLDNIRATCAQIKAWGGATNPSCGLHIHVGFPSDSVADIRRLTMLVGQFEDALYAMSGTPERRTGGYCWPIKNDRNKQVIWSVENKHALRNQGDFEQKYRLLNWRPFICEGRETVEFRVFSGSLNPAKIAAWVQVALTLVEMALDGVSCDWDARVAAMDSFGKTKGEQWTRYFARRCWFGRSASTKNYGELGHSHFNRKAAERMLKSLAIRHDVRLGLRAEPTAATATAAAVAALG